MALSSFLQLFIEIEKILLMREIQIFHFELSKQNVFNEDLMVPGSFEIAFATESAWTENLAL